jgi:hypothetical protein
MVYFFIWQRYYFFINLKITGKLRSTSCREQYIYNIIQSAVMPQTLFWSFPDCLPTVNYRMLLIHYYFWISNGLREFWEKATVLKLAARACSKQYCLTPSEASGELYCVGKLKNRSPKIICSLDFSLVTFFASRQRK